MSHVVKINNCLNSEFRSCLLFVQQSDVMEVEKGGDGGFCIPSG